MALTREEAQRNAAIMSRICDNIEIVMLGKRQVVELTVMALICGGHILLEDVPGVGKTTLVSALAKSIRCGFNRIQFTPDIMPSDVTGFSIFNQKTREFEFRPGAIMSNLVLADEINRASAKTQSSLLEAMEERHVTVDSKTYRLKEPFMVMATQNPLESYGTYPLPEAQIDRFLIKMAIGYPDFIEEVKMIHLGDRGKKAIRPVVTGDDVLRLRSDAENVFVSVPMEKYIVEIVKATRNSADLSLGSSPRGSISLMRMCRVYAMYQGREYVLPDDVRYLAPFILAHRITRNHDAKAAGRTPEMIIDQILGSIAVPVGEYTLGD
ncbi:MAG: MoxR family ATPase [Firmicutes bacterium]|nr:MoxR family ATPase [Bacillota bacterium]